MNFEPVTILGHSFHPVPTANTVSLYSDQYTSDRLPRQRSVDFIGMKDYGSKIGLPDQWNFRSDPWIQLNKSRSLWLFDLQCLSWRNKHYYELTSSDLKYAKAQWKQLFDDGRCFTNKTGTDTRHDYINVTNTTADDMEYQLLLLAGNKVDVQGNTEYFPEKYFGKQQAYPHRKIRAIDINKPLPAPELILKDPYVCHICTTIQPNGTKGIFPQFDGKSRGVIWAKDGYAYIWEKLIG